MDIRRFGIGYRRAEGPAGTQGVTGQAIHSDPRGVIAELAFRPRAFIAPHSNPNTTYFLVIEGGGFVQVGDERARVSAGEAVVWPAHLNHAAWTELTPMRAVVVEFAGGGDGDRLPGGAIEHLPASASAGDATGPAAATAPADGALAPRPAVPRVEHESPDEEPW